MADSKTVGAIDVIISAQTDRLEAGMRTAASQIASFGAMMGGAAAAITSFGLAAAENAVSGLVAMGAEALSTADNLADASTALGVNVQALRELQYAGKQSGLSVEDVDGALKKLQKTIGDAVAGEKVAIEAFDRLGLSADNLARMPIDEAFMRIAASVREIHNPAERASALVEVFGRSGQNLIPLINDVGELRKEFARLGGTLENESIQKMASANDAIDRLKTAFDGVKMALTSGAAEGIESIANRLTDLAVKAERNVPIFVDLASGLWNVIDTINSFTPSSLIIEFFSSLAEKASALLDSLDGIDRKMIELSKSGVRDAWEQMKKPKEEEFRWWEEEAKMRARLAEETRKQQEKDEEASAKKRAADGLKAYQKVMEEGRTKGNAAQRMLDEARTPFEVFEDKIRDIQKLAKEGFFTNEEVTKLVELAEEKYVQSMPKKKEVAMRSASVGYATQIDPRGVSAEAMRLAARQVQVVSDPALEVTNKLLADTNQSIKRIAGGVPALVQ